MTDVTPEVLSTAVRVSLAMAVLFVLWEAWVASVRGAVSRWLIANLRRIRARAEEHGVSGQQAVVHGAIVDARTWIAVLDRVEHGCLVLLAVGAWYRPDVTRERPTKADYAELPIELADALGATRREMAGVIVCTLILTSPVVFCTALFAAFVTAVRRERAALRSSARALISWFRSLSFDKLGIRTARGIRTAFVPMIDQPTRW